MTSKKKLKRKLKKKKAEFNQVWDDYQSLGRDYAGYVILYHDIIKLLSEFDNDLLLRAVRAADLRRIEKLQSDYAKLEEKFDVVEGETSQLLKGKHILKLRCNGLKAEIAQLKAPKLQVPWNGDPFEIVSDNDT